MKDIVEEALEYNVQQDVSNSVSSDEFGPPQFLYIGIGPSRGTLPTSIRNLIMNLTY